MVGQLKLINCEEQSFGMDLHIGVATDFSVDFDAALFDQQLAGFAIAKTLRLQNFIELHKTQAHGYGQNDFKVKTKQPLR
jgi:hypothetical protein